MQSFLFSLQNVIIKHLFSMLSRLLTILELLIHVLHPFVSALFVTFELLYLKGDFLYLRIVWVIEIQIVGFLLSDGVQDLIILHLKIWLQSLEIFILRVNWLYQGG